MSTLRLLTDKVGHPFVHWFACKYAYCFLVRVLLACFLSKVAGISAHMTISFKDEVEGKEVKTLLCSCLALDVFWVLCIGLDFAAMIFLTPERYLENISGTSDRSISGRSRGYYGDAAPVPRDVAPPAAPLGETSPGNPGAPAMIGHGQHAQISCQGGNLEGRCGICLEIRVLARIAPCGHLACQQCAGHVGTCPFCRREIAEFQPLFMP